MKIKKHYKNLILQNIDLIDRRLSSMVNTIIHTPSFQALEASWRNINFLVEQSALHKNNLIKIKILTCHYNELKKDLLRAADFDQSQFFNKVYTEEYSHPGGEPYGLLIGDYDFFKNNNFSQDTELLHEIAKVAASAFAPFIGNIAAHFFGIDHYSELQPTLNLSKALEQTQYTRWHTLRAQEDARFIGLSMPKVLCRQPYQNSLAYSRNPWFKEICANEQNYCWGNSCFYYAAAAVNSFATTGWFLDVRHVEDNITGTFQRDYFMTDPHWLISKPITNITITEQQERELSQCGFLPLIENKYSACSSFYTSSSIQKPARYNSNNANINASVISSLSFLLSASRFAHYIRVIMRDKVGGFISAHECQHSLQQWIMKYCATNSDNTQHIRHKYPLREAVINIKELVGQPGQYHSTIYIRPHFYIDSINAQLKLVSQPHNSHRFNEAPL